MNAPFATEIAALSDANRARLEPATERELMRLRHESFLALARERVPARPASFATAKPIPVDRSAGLPVAHGLPDAETVRTTIHTHGSLIVRGLIGAAGVRRLRSAVETAIAAREHVLSGTATEESMAWYSEFAPIKHADVRSFTHSSGVLAADSPRGVFELTEVFREHGVSRLASDFLGGPPVLSVEKSVFRRVAPRPFASWHQDGAFLGENSRTLDVWIALSDCGKTAPSLEVLPRRVARVLPTGAFFSWDLDEKEIRKEFPGFTTVLAQFEPGDAILFDQLCVHRSGHAEGMTESRLAIECWFFAAESVPQEYTGFVL
jgi:hypothetical protein